MITPKIIAEIGCNHKGDMSIARELIMTAATYCKADVVKFQKRNVFTISDKIASAKHADERCWFNSISFLVKHY